MTKSNKISKNVVKKIADLAKLKLNESDCNLFSKQMSNIISYISKLDEVSTKDIKPLRSIIPYQKNVMRNDIVKNSLKLEQSLKNSPKQLFLGIRDVYGKGGTYKFLQKKHRLSPEKIVEDILENLKKI